MLCELRAVADGDGLLHLQLGANGTDWLHYTLRGPVLRVKTAAGERRLSSRAALKLLLREIWLRESRLRESWFRDGSWGESVTNGRERAAIPSAKLVLAPCAAPTLKGERLP